MSTDQSTSRAWAAARGHLIAVAILCASSTMPAAAGSALGGAQAFVLTNGGNAQLGALLDAPGIDGAALQEAWAFTEPVNGTYNFSRINNAFALAEARGKKISLHLLASPREPTWLAQLGAQYYQTASGQRIVPWDSVYLSRYAEFLQALAQHLQTQGYADSLFDVSVVVPVGEMNLVDCRNGTLGTALPYNRAAYLQAWKTAIDNLHAAFPLVNKFLSPEHAGLVCWPTVDNLLFSSIMDYAIATHGSTFWMFAADLNADGSARTSDNLSYVAQTSLGYQTIWSATNDPNFRMGGTYPTNLKTAVCFGLSNGARYFEIYADDVLNPDVDIQGGIAAVHNPSACAGPALFVDGFE